MWLVLDATPLIYLIRSGFYKHFSDLDVELFTTGEVIEELKLNEPGYPENQIITRLIEDKILGISNPKKALKVIDGTHKGEASVIALAREKAAIAVIDDRIARLYAKAFRVKTVHSTFLVFLALKKGLISKQKAKDIIDSMIDAGWRCDVETYKNVFQIIDSID